jgi:hypothetical protein
VYTYTEREPSKEEERKKTRHIFMFIINIRQEEKELLHPY